MRKLPLACRAHPARGRLRRRPQLREARAPDAGPQFYGRPPRRRTLSLADLPWWGVFQDPVLTSLIDQALRQRLRRPIAAARVEEARARDGVASSQFFPQINYGAEASQQRLPTNLSGGTGEPETSTPST